MNDTMTDAQQARAAKLLTKPAREHVRSSTSIAHVGFEAVIGERRTRLVLRREPRRAADTGNLAPRSQLPIPATRLLIGAELEAR